MTARDRRALARCCPRDNEKTKKCICQRQTCIMLKLGALRVSAAGCESGAAPDSNTGDYRPGIERDVYKSATLAIGGCRPPRTRNFQVSCAYAAFTSNSKRIGITALDRSDTDREASPEMGAR